MNTIKELTDYEVAKEVRRVLLTRVGEAMAYHVHWGESFTVKNTVNVIDDLEGRAKWFHKINANNLTKEQLDELGFSKWSQEFPIRLIPIWLVPFLQQKIDAYCIDGESVNSVSKMDKDHRGGCVAYGVKEPT